MAPWLVTLLNLLPSLIEAIISGLRGSNPPASASDDDKQKHMDMITKYEAILKRSQLP